MSCKTNSSYPALRLLAGIAGIVLSVVCWLGVGLSAAMTAGLSFPLLPEEQRQVTWHQTVMLIPMAVGILGIIGPERRWALVAGSFLTLCISPLCFMAMLVSGAAGRRSEETFWMGLYVIIAAGYWLFISRRYFTRSPGSR